MTKKTLYRVLDGGKVIITPEPQETYVSTLTRLIADDGKILAKDGIETPCVDTDDPDGWEEKDAPEEQTEDAFIRPVAE